jgi:hypothetical protein
VRLVPMLREYTVFNVDQCDKLPEAVYATPAARMCNPDSRDQLADDFLHCTDRRVLAPNPFPHLRFCIAAYALQHNRQKRVICSR